MGRKAKMSPSWLVGVFFLCSVAANNDTVREPKRGRGGSPNVKCGKWTTRTVNIGMDTVAEFEADKGTKRCVVTYLMTTCREITGTQNNAREAMHSQSELTTQNLRDSAKG